MTNHFLPGQSKSNGAKDAAREALSRRAAIKRQCGTVFFGDKIIKGQITLLFCQPSGSEEPTEQAGTLPRGGNWTLLRPSYDRSRRKGWIKPQNKCLLFYKPPAAWLIEPVPRGASWPSLGLEGPLTAGPGNAMGTITPEMQAFGKEP